MRGRGEQGTSDEGSRATAMRGAGQWQRGTQGDGDKGRRVMVIRGTM